MKTALCSVMVVLLGAVLAGSEKAKTEISVESLPPSVVKTVPQSGDTDVDPDLAEISVTFSKNMKDKCWSFCFINKDHYPKTKGNPEYKKDRRTCTMKVELKPQKNYAIWINTVKFQNFQDTQGHPAVPYLLVFRTGKRKK